MVVKIDQKFLKMAEDILLENGKNPTDNVTMTAVEYCAAMLEALERGERIGELKAEKKLSSN